MRIVLNFTEWCLLSSVKSWVWDDFLGGVGVGQIVFCSVCPRVPSSLWVLFLFFSFLDFGRPKLPTLIRLLSMYWQLFPSIMLHRSINMFWVSSFTLYKSSFKFFKESFPIAITWYYFLWWLKLLKFPCVRYADSWTWVPAPHPHSHSCRVCLVRMLWVIPEREKAVIWVGLFNSRCSIHSTALRSSSSFLKAFFNIIAFSLILVSIWGKVWSVCIYFIHPTLQCIIFIFFSESSLKSTYIVW